MELFTESAAAFVQFVGSHCPRPESGRLVEGRVWSSQFVAAFVRFAGPRFPKPELERPAGREASVGRLLEEDLFGPVEGLQVVPGNILLDLVEGASLLPLVFGQATMDLWQTRVWVGGRSPGVCFFRGCCRFQPG